MKFIFFTLALMCACVVKVAGDRFFERRGHIDLLMKGYFAFARLPARLLNEIRAPVLPIVSPEATIPRRLFLTTHIPKERIPNLLKSYADDFEVQLFDDREAFDSMSKHFPLCLTTYVNLKLGAHRADLWRYCMLFKYGGLYMDIKVVPHVSLTRFAGSHEKYTWFAVLDSSRMDIFNGIIATPPRNPIIYECIQHILRNPSPRWYMQYCHYMLMLIEANYNIQLRAGTYEREHDRIVLLQESCRVVDENGDRMGLSCKVYDSSHEHVFDSRDASYPW